MVGDVSYIHLIIQRYTIIISLLLVILGWNRRWAIQ